MKTPQIVSSGSIVAPVVRHRTALSRATLSRPIKRALEDGVIAKDSEVFDFGCGRGDDLRLLRNEGIVCAGWDPAFAATAQRREADVVNLGYVINVIESPAERAAVLREAWALARNTLVVAARLTYERTLTPSAPYGDGCLTGRRTFQKFFEQHELRAWIETALGVAAIPAAPGIFYVFRDPARAQVFAASQYRTRQAVPQERRHEQLFNQYRDLFQGLMAFVADRGRLPEETELEIMGDLRLAVGSIRRAWTIIQRVTGTAEWEAISAKRSEELLIHLALDRFRGRLKFGQLAPALQLDVRAFFRTYSEACQQADVLLFSAGNTAAVDEACRRSGVGKLTPAALYIHTSAIAKLTPILRIYEGCARSYVGSVEGANVVKLHRLKPQISYLAYPTFDRTGHPALAGSLLVPLQTFKVNYREYSSSDNPPILHRKEEFVSMEHPLREKFARLTAQEERAGLYENPEIIGMRVGWESALEARGVSVKGHRVVSHSTGPALKGARASSKRTQGARKKQGAAGARSA